MRHLFVVLLAACGGGTRAAPPPPSNTSTNAAPATPVVTLERRDIADSEGGVHAVWIRPEREAGIETTDPCCGLTYDGNKYDDALASCEVDELECAPNRTPVYPGLADDSVCGEQRRCVPLPAARIVVEDSTVVSGTDWNEAALPVGGPEVKHARVDVGRPGFVVVWLAGKPQLVAVDYGDRYTIVVRDGAIKRVTRDL